MPEVWVCKIDILTNNGYIVAMKYEVVIKKKAFQGMRNLPRNALMVLRSLLLDLENGPVQPKYMNYSKLEES